MNAFIQIAIAITSALAGGGLTAIFLIREKKRDASVNTDGKVIEGYAKLVDDLRVDCATMAQRCEQLRVEKREQWERILHDEKLITKYQTMHCTLVKCPNREPPLGSLIPCEKNGNS